MGLNKNLKLIGNDFTNAATAFFIAYLIAEIPNGYFLQLLPPAKWLSLNVILWGISTACTAAATNYHSLLAARIFLGIFEAAIAPSLMLFSSQWYTKSEQAPRFSLWYCGLGVGQIVGGLVSFAFQQVKREGFEGWRIMFVVLGILTVIVGVAIWLVLPDNPMKAKWLSEAEKGVLLRHVAVNRTGIENRRFKLSQVFEISIDVQLWLLTFTTILVSSQNYRKLLTVASDKPLDVNFERGGDDIFSDAHSQLWIHATGLCSSQYAKRHCLHHECLSSWLRRPKNFQSLGLDHSMLHPWSFGRRLDVICTVQQPRCPARWYLPRKLHHWGTAAHLSMDDRQCSRSDEARD